MTKKRWPQKCKLCVKVITSPVDVPWHQNLYHKDKTFDQLFDFGHFSEHTERASNAAKLKWASNT